MLAVRTRVRETFKTLRTLERFLAAVQTLVLGQVVFVFERLRADVALVGALTWNVRNRFVNNDIDIIEEQKGMRY